MSAGDVKFVGWVGSNPKYYDLPASITFAPTDIVGVVKKTIQINRVCFAKDAPIVIQQLPLGDASFSTSVLGTNGEVVNQAVGGGYVFKGSTWAPYNRGFALISAQYEKTVSTTFEIGLPQGLGVYCEAGVCSLKYNDVVLEEFDSGTGQCTSGLDLEIFKFGPVRWQWWWTWWGSPFSFRTEPCLSSGGIPLYVIGDDWQQFAPDAIFADVRFTCNGAEFDSMQWTNRQSSYVSVQTRYNYYQTYFTPDQSLLPRPPNWVDIVNQNMTTEEKQKFGEVGFYYTYQPNTLAPVIEVYQQRATLYLPTRPHMGQTNNADPERVAKWKRVGNDIFLILDNQILRQYTVP